MKCSHPMCNRGIGLVSYQRSFRKGLYCSPRCRDNYGAAQRVSRADVADFMLNQLTDDTYLRRAPGLAW